MSKVVIPTEKWKGEEQVVIVKEDGEYDIGVQFAQGGIQYLPVEPYKHLGNACRYVERNFHGKDHPDNRRR